MASSHICKARYWMKYIQLSLRSMLVNHSCNLWHLVHLRQSKWRLWLHVYLINHHISASGFKWLHNKVANIAGVLLTGLRHVKLIISENWNHFQHWISWIFYWYCISSFHIILHHKEKVKPLAMYLFKASARGQHKAAYQPCSNTFWPSTKWKWDNKWVVSVLWKGYWDVPLDLL